MMGIILHSGNINGGHYIAVVENDDSWIEFNDSIQTPKVESIITYLNNIRTSYHITGIFYKKIR